MEHETDIIYIKQKKVKHWTVLLLFLLILAVGLNLRIKHVEVLGNETYTAEEAEALIFSDYWDRNTVVCLYNSLTGRKKKIPFVDDYKIVLNGPFDCELRFYEKKPVGCIKYMSNYMYFDKDGVMIESSDRQLDGVPVIEGLSFGYIVLGKQLPIDNKLLLNSIMNVTQQMALYDIGCSTIKYNGTNNTITAIIDNGDIEVYLGTDDGLAAKISALNDMLPEIRKKHLKGMLDLGNYDDNKKGSVSSFRLRDGESASDAAAGADQESGGAHGDEPVQAPDTSADGNGDASGSAQTSGASSGGGEAEPVTSAAEANETQTETDAYRQ